MITILIHHHIYIFNSEKDVHAEGFHEGEEPLEVYVDKETGVVVEMFLTPVEEISPFAGNGKWDYLGKSLWLTQHNFDYLFLPFVFLIIYESKINRLSRLLFILFSPVLLYVIYLQ